MGFLQTDKMGDVLMALKMLSKNKPQENINITLLSEVARFCAPNP